MSLPDIWAKWLRSSNRGSRNRLRVEALEDRVTPAFTPGDVFGAGVAPFKMYNLTGGGNFAGKPEFAMLPSRAVGQIAWSPDLATAYVAMFDTNSVITVS